MSHSDIFRRKFKKNALSYRELDIDANIPDAGQTMNVTESLESTVVLKSHGRATSYESCATDRRHCALRRSTLDIFFFKQEESILVLIDEFQSVRSLHNACLFFSFRSQTF